MTFTRVTAKALLTLLIISIPLFLGSCAEGRGRDFPDVRWVRGSSRDGYYFKMWDADRARLAAAINALHGGETVDEVIRRLGPPDSDHYAGSKGTGPGTHYFVYQFVQFQKGDVDLRRNQRVDIEFDINTGKMNGVLSDKVPEVNSR